jgi:hypothetical protein
MWCKRCLLLVLVALAACCRASAAASASGSNGDNLPNPTHAGYIDVQKNAGSAMYYQYYEADSACVCVAIPDVLVRAVPAV